MVLWSVWKSVCVLIPSNLYSSSSQKVFVLSLQTLKALCWVISYPLQNKMLRCSKSELDPKNLLFPACRKGNFSHSRFGKDRVFFFSGKFLARHFAFVFTFFLFPFYTVHLLLVLRFQIRKTSSRKPLSFHSYIDRLIYQSSNFLICVIYPEVFQLGLTW